MRRKNGWLLALALSALILSLFTRETRAELLPAGNFRGKPLSEWGQTYLVWAVKTGLGGEPLPNTIDGIRYLPPNFGGDNFVANLTIDQGTPLLGSPFFVYGERYENGTADDPNDPIIDSIFNGVTMRVLVNGAEVLQGGNSTFADRRFGIAQFAEPIVYAAPNSRLPAVAAIFSAGGYTAIYDNLAQGQHTIRHEFDSLFGPASFTYNVTVVPEPAALGAIAMTGLAMLAVRRRSRSVTPSCTRS